MNDTRQADRNARPATSPGEEPRQDLSGRLNLLARRLTLAVALAGVGFAAFLHLYSQRFGALVSDSAVDSAQVVRMSPTPLRWRTGTLKVQISRRGRCTR
jgi:outer membrane protein TolC